MNSLLKSENVASSELLITIATYLLFAAALVLALLLNKVSGASESIWSERFRTSSAGALVATLAAGWLFTLGFRRAAADRRTKFWFPVFANVLVVLFCLVLSEVGLRTLAAPDPLGVRIGTTRLVPYDWKALAAMNRGFLEHDRSKTSFYTEDPLLGWTIGPNREGNGGMYKSSAEGLRSMSRGENLHSREAGHRIALFGDSFTFGLDVPFEQSWGHYLELNSDATTQVVNFGVDGYGVDQAYLRFKREAARWSPSVSVLAFIQDDLYRNVTVYPFFRLSWEIPFSKPRFEINDDKLELLNVPNIPPDLIFGRRSTSELPLLDYDANFESYWWEHRPSYASYLVRVLATKFPPWVSRNAHTSDDMAVQLGSRLIEEFAGAAQSVKTGALIVYLPARNDFDGSGPILLGRLHDALTARGIKLHDLTSCLTRQVPPGRLFVEGKPHYSGEANAAVARCIQPLVAAYLN